MRGTRQCRHDNPVFGKAAAAIIAFSSEVDAGSREENASKQESSSGSAFKQNRSSSVRPQTNWSIRVPCPGGRGACAGGAELESSASLSLLGAGVEGGLLLTAAGVTATGVTGGVAEMLETLMGTGILPWVSPTVAGGNQRGVNSTVKRRAIGAAPPRMVNGRLQICRKRSLGRGCGRPRSRRRSWCGSSAYRDGGSAS